jgi:hypothetical protein
LADEALRRLGLAVRLRSHEIHRQQQEALVPRERELQQQVFQQWQQVLPRQEQVLLQQEQVQEQVFQQQQVLEFRLLVLQQLDQHRLFGQQLFWRVLFSPVLSLQQPSLQALHHRPIQGQLSSLLLF